MAGETCHSSLLGNLRGQYACRAENYNSCNIKHLPMCAYEVGQLNIYGGKVFHSNGQSRAESRGHLVRARGSSKGFLEKPQPRLREDIKMSVQASTFPGSPYAYRTNEAGTSISHTVKEGQTLTSIARQYGTSVQEIAFMNRIDNVDLLQAGQLLLVPVHSEVFQTVLNGTVRLDRKAPKDHNMMQVSAVSIMPAKLRAPVMSSLLSIRFVKATAPFVVLAPVLLLCIRYLVDTIQLRVNEEALNQRTQKEKLITQHGPSHRRWRGILDEDRETQVLDAHGHNIMDSEENQSQDAYEEIRQSYAELEPAYLKFLADSGLSKSGYWRGGMPSTTSEENVR
eukprot:Gb_38515 [translate_table: standard]